jgi:hypothetical protein
MRVKMRSMGPSVARLRRHEAAAVREERDLRHLPHVRRLAAHVRAGDQQQLARAREARVVRNEMLDLALHDQVAAPRGSRCSRRGESAAREVERLAEAASAPRASRAAAASAIDLSWITCAFSSSISAS